MRSEKLLSPIIIDGDVWAARALFAYNYKGGIDAITDSDKAKKSVAPPPVRRKS